MRVGLVELEGWTGKDIEKRFVRGAVLVVQSAAADIARVWLWKLALPDEPAEGAGLLGVATCSTGLGFAAIDPPVKISLTSIAAIFLLFRGDIMS